MRPHIRHGGAPLLRYRRKDLLAAGVERVAARTVSVKDGQPVLDNGRVLDVRNVIWCTGFRPDYSWIRIPIEIGQDGYPVQYRGAVDSAPGLYFVGMLFLHSFASMLIAGTSKDAERVAKHIASRPASRPAPAPTAALALSANAQRRTCAVIDDRDATSILVWNGRVSRTRPTPTRAPPSRPFQDGEHEHDQDDHEDGQVIERRVTHEAESGPHPDPGNDPPRYRWICPTLSV